MRVLLRSTETGLFYAGPEHWTQSHTEALDFRGTDLALDHVSESGLPDMEVLMRFDDPVLEIPLFIAGLGK